MGRRARRRHRPALLAAVLLAALAATPTFAFHREVVDFFSRETAPERIQLDFPSLREHTAEASSRVAGPTYTADGLAREVLTVQLDGEARPLWVVPTTEGAFCYRLHFGISCLAPGDKSKLPKIAVGGLSTKHGDGLDWIVGPVLDQAVQEVELLYQDGERVKIPFVWVSPPIDAGFYAYDVPADREEPGRLAIAVIGLDEDGGEVAQSCVPVSPDEVARSAPEAAAVCKRRG
jgi:hypothetical protein